LESLDKIIFGVFYDFSICVSFGLFKCH